MGHSRPVQRPPLSLTFCGDRFDTPQTLTFAVILPRTPSLYVVRHCLVDGNEHIGRSNATSSDKTYFILRKLCLSCPVMCLDLHGYRRNENRGEKVKINKKFSAADDRR